jgi:hypothetical protein
MIIDDMIQDLAVKIYEDPLAKIRKEAEYPNLENPLHIVVLLIDCDTEIDMNGILGFLENSTGRYLRETIQALTKIGAPKCAAVFESVKKCMEKHNVTWERLREDFEGTVEYEITSFQRLHGSALDSFTKEVLELTGNFSLFNSLYSPEDAYSAFINYLEGKSKNLKREIEKRNA